MRVFSRSPKGYYRLKQPDWSFDAVLARTRERLGTGEIVSNAAFESACLSLKKLAQGNAAVKGLFNGVHVPFVCPQNDGGMDLGSELERRWLPAVGGAFKNVFPRYHFKYTLQGDASLAGRVVIAENSRYEGFLRARKKGAVAGWYFPSALLEYDVASQRGQTVSLPLAESLALSGGFDAAAALIGSPDLLVNEVDYPPVLCLSAFRHADERLMLCFKAYGLSLEFWCMSQMLSPGITQVSEQWSGGLTLFTEAG